MTIAILEESIESLLPEAESTTQDTYPLNLREALRMLYLEEIFSPRGNYVSAMHPRSVTIAGLPNKPSAADMEEYLLSLCGKERRKTFSLLQKIVENQSYTEGVSFELMMENEANVTLSSACPELVEGSNGCVCKNIMDSTGSP